MKIRNSAMYLCSAVLLLSAQGVFAGDKNDKAKAEVAGADPVICKRQKVTGSHFKKKICMKKSQWLEQTRQSQRLMDEVTSPTGSNSG
ncbi:MAG: hypothetical protein AAF513_19605 [Pseudomonadota bacterium]